MGELASAGSKSVALGTDRPGKQSERLEKAIVVSAASRGRRWSGQPSRRGRLFARSLDHFFSLAGPTAENARARAARLHVGPKRDLGYATSTEAGETCATTKRGSLLHADLPLTRETYIVSEILPILPPDFCKKASRREQSIARATRFVLSSCLPASPRLAIGRAYGACQLARLLARSLPA